MNKYAVLFYADEGIYYYNPLAAKTYETALDEALEYIASDHFVHDDGDLPFNIIEVSNISEHTTEDHQDFFNKKRDEDRKRAKKQREQYDREQYEQLKKKFADG